MSEHDPSDLTMRELSRQLSANTSAHRELSQTIKELQIEIAKTYVRKDVYTADQALTESRRAEIVEEVTALKSQRDWIVRIVMGLVLTALVGLVIVQGGEVPA